MNKNLIILIIALLTLLVGVSFYAFRLSQEKTRIQKNQNTLMSQLEISKTKNDLYKSEIGVLQLSNRELKEFRGELVQEIDNLSVKLNQVASISKNAISTNSSVSTIIKDTIFINTHMDTIIVHKFDYEDEWLTFEGYMQEDSLYVVVESRDSLLQVIYDDRGWFRRIFKFWESPILKQSISSANPNSRITYSEYIQLTKKR